MHVGVRNITVFHQSVKCIILCKQSRLDLDRSDICGPTAELVLDYKIGHNCNHRGLKIILK